MLSAGRARPRVEPPPLFHGLTRDEALPDVEAQVAVDSPRGMAVPVSGFTTGASYHVSGMGTHPVPLPPVGFGNGTSRERALYALQNGYVRDILRILKKMLDLMLSRGRN